jgi:hypothetical protein
MDRLSGSDKWPAAQQVVGCGSWADCPVQGASRTRPIGDTWVVETPTDRDLDRFLDQIRSAPGEVGRLELIVRRPAVDAREVLTEAVLDPAAGLVGDDWIRRGSRSTPDGSPDTASQLTLMCVRVLAAIEPDRSRWPLAGDQLYVDFDLSPDNLPPGTRLTVGEATIEVTDKPHRPCAKFAARFGEDARRWVGGPAGEALRMRGVKARIVRGGVIRAGDAIRRD